MADNYLNAPGLSSESRSSSFSKDKRDSSNVSLSINYLPSKFSSTLVAPGARKRKNTGKDGTGLGVKRGGGVEAFKSGTARVAGENDEDYDGVVFARGRVGKRNRLKWNKFKFVLFVANLLLTLYSITALIVCLLTYFNVWPNADVVRVGNAAELGVSTAAATLGIITSLLGWAGLLLNNRAFLAVYSFSLWICFIFLVAPGYMTYKKRAFNLEGKINAQWSRDLGFDGRLRVQNKLGCCGYFSPFIEATISQTCYARSILPGCKAPYLDFERVVLTRWYTVAFSLVPLQLFIMIAALLCSNHVTYRFGKGMTPKRYRLSLNSMAVIMDAYATQLVDQYGNSYTPSINTSINSSGNLEPPPPKRF